MKKIELIYFGMKIRLHCGVAKNRAANFTTEKRELWLDFRLARWNQEGNIFCNFQL